MHKRICWLDGCEEPSVRWGLCGPHQTKWQQEHPRKGTAVHGSLEKKFEFYIERDSSECGTWGARLPGCWHWGGTLSDFGYGLLNRSQQESDNKTTLIRVHRYIYERANGPIPEGYEVDHLCRVRPCANPDHLEAVTSQTNNLRGTSPAALHAAKEKCPEGHLYDRSSAAGARTCSTCIRKHSISRARGDGKGGYQSERTHCPERHPYEGDNLVLEKRKRKDGTYGEVRKCRTCVVAVRAARNARKRSER